MKLRPLLLAAVAACGSTSTPTSTPASPSRFVITAQRVYISPDAPPLDHAWVLVDGGQIAAVGTGALPTAGRDDACGGGVITAGFHNSHVHLIDPAFADATNAPAARLQAPLTELTTKWGFVTITDTGSNPIDTLALRARVASGELAGPAILTAGAPIYPKDGIPFYLMDLPPPVLARLQQPTTVDEALAMVKRNLAAGADGTKLFIATPHGGGEIRRMDPEIAHRAVEATHEAGKLAMVHPTDVDGVIAAVDAGVDIVVHTTIDPDPSVWPPALIQRMVAQHVSVVPTLQLWGYELAKAKAPKDVSERIIKSAEVQLAAFLAAGGQVLFGTDAGYMAIHDPTEEYVRMAEAGMTPMQILASLTTAPAARWKASELRGRVAEHLAADLVVLDGDPATDVKRFAQVRCAYRAGAKVYPR